MPPANIMHNAFGPNGGQLGRRQNRGQNRRVGLSNQNRNVQPVG